MNFLHNNHKFRLIKNLSNFLKCRDLTEKFTLIEDFTKAYNADKSVFNNEIISIANNSDESSSTLQINKEADSTGFDLDQIYYPQNIQILSEKEIKVKVLLIFKFMIYIKFINI